MLILKTVECENTSSSRHESAHNLLKCMLSQYTSSDYSQIKKEENGKPYIDGTAFSISHSNNVACVALVVDEQEIDEGIVIDQLSIASSVGADVESVFDKRIDNCRKIAQHKFFQDEIKRLDMCSCEEEYIKLFCLMWTQKESYSKFTGSGLKDALSFDTTSKSVFFKIYSDFLMINNQLYALSVCYNSKLE